ncbi:DUF2357 domain-containing protein [Paenibacillus motobuensis]|uniref:DUF2357 domain-containing protein n=1 Tax=Paenibacillus TaxID=44249 RepID=UPI0020417A5B|nr:MULTISPECIES: DUF2357 domain-containing protein [Paenibacillus]MCM3040656.1 DUF2357 domain-containing protein [Paenibacillus lutimineralis]MCM3647760.1 DUF2357 domain-containing protein [Paenibacillus motobuensis]
MAVKHFSEIQDGWIVETCASYIIVFNSADEAKIAREQHPTIFTCSDGENIGVLNVRNSIGSVMFMSKRLEARCPSKLSETEFERMMSEIVEKMALLPFDFNTNSFTSIESMDIRRSEVLYHAFLVIRHWLKKPEPMLEGAIRSIWREPIRREMLSVRTQDVWNVSHVSANTLASIVTGNDPMVRLPEWHQLSRTGIARQMAKAKGDTYFPMKIHESHVERSLDTVENRFVLYVLRVCLDILFQFCQSLKGSRPSLNTTTLIAQTNQMIESLEGLLRSYFFHDIGMISMLPFHSIALQRRNGYKELLIFYRALTGSFYHPLDNLAFRQAIELKDIARLYEIWSYFKTLEVIEKIYSVKPKSALIGRSDDFRQTLGNGVTVIYELDGSPLKVFYNRSFPGKDLRSSYSLPYRPDIVLEYRGELYVLDAKFKLRFAPSFDRDEEDTEGKGTDRDDAFTFKNEDIHKMHAYKDGIHNVRVSCILYPGLNSEKVTFFEQGDERSGVGAVSLRPGQDAIGLEAFVRKELNV